MSKSTYESRTTALPKRRPAAGDASEKRSVNHGVFRKCDGCGETLAADVLQTNYEVCPSCGKHHRLSPAGFRQLLLDPDSFVEWDANVGPLDPLGFKDGRPYAERVLSARRSSGSREAIETGSGRIDGHAVAFGIFVFGFMGGSMGSAVGEKIARLFERARDHSLPVVLLSSSGGARMQEGVLSLMQMAKTVAALERFRQVRLPFISVLLHPTTGGVAASFALLGDINLAEPDALIGFAGPRVIETTIGQKLPAGFQRSEFVGAHGMIDRIVSRLELRTELATLLAYLTPKR